MSGNGIPACPLKWIDREQRSLTSLCTKGRRKTAERFRVPIATNRDGMDIARFPSSHESMSSCALVRDRFFRSGSRDPPRLGRTSRRSETDPKASLSYPGSFRIRSRNRSGSFLPLTIDCDCKRLASEGNLGDGNSRSSGKEEAIHRSRHPRGSAWIRASFPAFLEAWKRKDWKITL